MPYAASSRSHAPPNGVWMGATIFPTNRKLARVNGRFRFRPLPSPPYHPDLHGIKRVTEYDHFTSPVLAHQPHPFHPSTSSSHLPVSVPFPWIFGCHIICPCVTPASIAWFFHRICVFLFIFSSATKVILCCAWIRTFARNISCWG